MNSISMLLLCTTLLAAQNDPLSGAAPRNASDADYYQPAYKLYGTALRSALHEIVKGHTVVSYASLWNHFNTTDKKPDGTVWDMYSDIPGGTPPYTFTFVSDQCGNYSVEGDCYNREHSWPKSWFNDVSPPYSDLFHLFPTDGKVNGMRSNWNFGNVSAPTWTSKNGSKLGPNTFPGYSGTVFEPITAYKGDFARAHFYMSVRYYTEDGGWSTSGGTNKSELLPWYSALLYSWHLLDTVSAKEIARNDAVFGIQKNRNPFVDHPEFAAEIWRTGDAPSVVTAAAADPQTIVIDFSRYLDSLSAVAAANFVLDHSIGNPASIAWGVNSDVSKIVLTVPALAPGTTYSIQIKNQKSINLVAMADTTINVKTSGTSSVSSERIQPLSPTLEQNYPNPFNPTTTIGYETKKRESVSLKVYDLLGKPVATLVDRVQEAGTYSVAFTAADLPSGMYFYRIIAGNHSETRRMVLQK